MGAVAQGENKKMKKRSAEKIEVNNENLSDAVYLAVKNDDVILFEKCMGVSQSCGEFSYGRFPVFSLMCLFGARRLMKKYAVSFLRCADYENYPERPDAYAAFSSEAGKCLRLYAEGATVSPLEMLMILDKNGTLKKYYPITRRTNEIEENLAKIYSIKYGLEVKCERDAVYMERRPLTRREKKRLAVSCVSVLLCAAIIVSTPFVVNVFVPFIGVKNNGADNSGTRTPQTVNVTDGSGIDLSSSDTYVLDSDVTVDLTSAPSEVTASIDGNGHTLTFINASSAPINSFGGALSDLVIEYASVDFSADDAYSFLIGKNSGTVSDVTLNISGRINAKANAEDTGVTISGIASENTENGIIKNCTVNADIVLSGEVKANAEFSCVTDSNAGTVSDCVIYGSVVSDTVDVCCVAANNGGTISNCRNNAAVSETCDEYTWSPLAAGIVITNYGTVTDCSNNGEISASSGYSYSGERGDDYNYYTLSVSGIAAANADGGVITKCSNNGKISADSVENIVYAGGITALNSTSDSFFYMPTVSYCTNAASVTATVVRVSAYTGGVVGFSKYGKIYSCENGDSAAISLTASETGVSSAQIICGGAAGVNDSGTVTLCENYSAVNAASSDETTYSGGVIGFNNYSCVKNSNSGAVVSVSDSGENHTGGVAGGNYGSIQNCYNKGVIYGETKSSQNYVGGIHGYGYTLQYCLNDGGVNGKSDAENFIGGVSGYNFGKITYCVNRAAVFAENGVCRAGGITAYNAVTESGYSGYVSLCVSDCEIKIDTSAEKPSFAGGIVGENEERAFTSNGTTTTYGAAIQYCYSLAAFSAADAASGGILGLSGNYVYNNNSFTSSAENHYYYYANSYAKADGVTFAVAKVATADGADYTDGSDLNATASGKDAITQTENYKTVLASVVSLAE
jgi:hypothetical protein